MEWISVEDRLPIEGQKVHVIYLGHIDGRNGEIMTMEYTKRSGFYSHCLNIENFNHEGIDHWIPYEAINFPN